MKFKTQDVQNTCDPASFLPVQDLTGENIPYYNTAACFWQILEDNKPGLIKKVFQSAKSTPLGGESDFFDLLEDIYGSDLDSFMIDNFYYVFQVG